MTETLPVGWVSTSLGDICARKVAQEPPTEQPVPYIDISSIDRSTKRIGATKLVTVKDAPTRARQWVCMGDVLVSMTRPNLNAVAQVGSDLDGAVASTGFDVLRPLEVDCGWVFYRVRTNEFVADVCEDLQGVVYPAIRPHDVRRHRLPLPPIGEQHRIVEAIESYLTRLDDAVATLERVQRNLKRYRASVLKAAVEGRLVPTDAELARAEGRDYEPASVLLERILAERRRRWEEAELAKMKAKGQTPRGDGWKAKYWEPVEVDSVSMPPLPEGWCWSNLGELFEVKVGSTPSRSKPEYWNGGIPWVSSGEVSFCRIAATRETISEVGLNNSSTHLNPAGSVLLGMIGEGKTRGQAAILNIAACNNQNSAAIWVGESGLPPEYVYYYLMGQYEEIRTRGSGNNQPALNKSRVQAIPIPLPPIEELRRIVAEVSRQVSVIDSLEIEARRGVARCARLRQSILKWAFEGRLVDQDPTDEPASALLERIQAERGKVGSRGKRARWQRAREEPAA